MSFEILFFLKNLFHKSFVKDWVNRDIWGGYHKGLRGASGGDIERKSFTGDVQSGDQEVEGSRQSE